jgi:hypothetical protein
MQRKREERTCPKLSKKDAAVAADDGAISQFTVEGRAAFRSLR